MNAAIWPVVLGVVSKQGGLITRRQALKAGCSKIDWLRLLRLGRMRSLGRGLYDAQPPTNWFHRELHAALLLTGKGAVVSYRAAACLYRFWGIEGYPVEVTVPRGRRILSGPFVMHTAALAKEDISLDKALPVTTVVRTLCDLATVLDPDALACAFESVRRGRTKELPLLAEHLKQQRKPREGTEALVALLADSERRPARSMESPFEVLMWRRLAMSGLPLPTPQVPFEDENGRKYRLDFAWPAQQVAIEVDGFGFHSDRKAYRADAEKMAALKRAGWKVLRIWWERYLNELPAFFNELRTDLGIFPHVQLEAKPAQGNGERSQRSEKTGSQEVLASVGV